MPLSHDKHLRHSSPDILLVTMPVAAIETPSAALGLLKAILTRGGFRCGVVYGNLALVEWGGAAVVDLEKKLRSHDLAPWLFRQSLLGPDLRPA